MHQAPEIVARLPKRRDPLLLVLGLCAWLFASPSCAAADPADDLQGQYDATQREMNANAAQIMSLENKLQVIPRKAAQAGPNGGASDSQSIQNAILDLKQKNNDLYAQEDAIGIQLRKMGRDPDHPRSSRNSASASIKPAEPPVAAVVPDNPPLEKRDIGDLASADVNAFPPEIIPLKPITVPTQNPPPAPVANIAPPVPPVQIDPAVEQAIDEQVRRQKPVVDALFAPPPPAPEPPSIAAAAPVAPAEPPPQAEPPTTDWGSVLLGTLIVGGAVAGGIAASSSSGGGYSAPSGGYGGGGGHGGGGGYGGAVHCH